MLSLYSEIQNEFFEVVVGSYRHIMFLTRNILSVLY